MEDKKKAFNWGPGVFLISYQTIFLVSFPLYLAFFFPFSWGIWLSAFVLLYMTGLSITAGYHRYFAHRSFKTNKVVEGIILFFSSMSAQGSALRWAYDHRQHHAFVDTDEDPYSIKRGFWYAHFLWILEEPQQIDPKVVSDLMRNKLVMFQHQWYATLMIATNAFAFFALGWIFDNYWGAFFVTLWLRLFLLHHFTWFINSLAHTWGDKPFCDEQTAVDNYLIAFLTFGEGYHNFHHTFANDYRNGIRWFHFDPTKWLIWTLHKLKLAHNLKVVDAASIKKRMVIERKNLLLDQIKKHWYLKRDELSKQTNELSEKLLMQLSHFSQLREKYYELKRCTQEKDLLKTLKIEIKSIKKEIRRNWRQWSKLSNSIMRLKPLPIG